ncbi:MAG TPA: NADPH oxidase family protein, partial [Gammaproteobacteria bacterium]|nr:NADPH oxidase family protein [Gammaproteobacteria bacterium]
MENRRTSYCDRINQYIFSGFHYIKHKVIFPINNNKSWSLQAMAYLAASAFIGARTGMQVREDTDDLAYSVARASGAMLRYIVVPSVILPTLVACTSRLQRSGIGRYLGLNNRVLTHKLIAGGIASLGLIHSAGHLAYNKENYLKLPGITGLIMAGSFIFPLAGVYLIHYLKPQSQFSFGFLVKRPHQVGAVIFITAFGIHTTDLRLLPFAAAMGGLWFLNRFYEYFSYQHKVMLKSIRAIENTDYLLLRITIPPHFNLSNYLPGQYCELALSNPSMNRFLEAAHPFTIVTIDQHTHSIYLAIRQRGWWTTQLGKSTLQKDLPATLWGPYGSPLNSFYKHSQLTLIGAGIGMTPFLAYIFWLVERQHTSPIISLNLALTKIEEAFLIIKALNHPNIKRINFIESVNIYISRQKDIQIQAALSKIRHQKHLHFVFPENVKTQIARAKEEKYPINPVLEEQVDDDFLVDFGDPELVQEEFQIVEKDELIQLASLDEKRHPPSQPFPSNQDTPIQTYPALNTTGLFTGKEQRKIFNVNIYTRHMNADQILAHTLFTKVAVCAGDGLTKEVTEAAIKYGKKLYK